MVKQAATGIPDPRAEYPPAAGETGGPGLKRGPPRVRFVLLSLGLHLLLVVFIPKELSWLQPRARAMPSFKLTLQSPAQTQTRPPPAKPKQTVPRKKQPPVTVKQSAPRTAPHKTLPPNDTDHEANSQQLLDDAQRAVESLLRQERQQSAQRRFGRAVPKSQVEWLNAPQVTASKAFDLETYAAGDGDTMVVMKYANGRKQCFNVRHADPFDPFDAGIWRFIQCN